MRNKCDVIPYTLSSRLDKLYSEGYICFDDMYFCKLLRGIKYKHVLASGVEKIIYAENKDSIISLNMDGEELFKYNPLSEKYEIYLCDRPGLKYCDVYIKSYEIDNLIKKYNGYVELTPKERAGCFRFDLAKYLRETYCVELEDINCDDVYYGILTISNSKVKFDAIKSNRESFDVVHLLDYSEKCYFYTSRIDGIDDFLSELDFKNAVLPSTMKNLYDDVLSGKVTKEQFLDIVIKKDGDIMNWRMSFVEADTLYKHHVISPIGEIRRFSNKSDAVKYYNANQSHDLDNLNEQMLQLNSEESDLKTNYNKQFIMKCGSLKINAPQAEIDNFEKRLKTISNKKVKLQSRIDKLKKAN